MATKPHPTAEELSKEIEQSCDGMFDSFSHTRCIAIIQHILLQGRLMEAEELHKESNAHGLISSDIEHRVIELRAQLEKMEKE